MVGRKIFLNVDKRNALVTIRPLFLIAVRNHFDSPQQEGNECPLLDGEVRRIKGFFQLRFTDKTVVIRIEMRKLFKGELFHFEKYFLDIYAAQVKAIDPSLKRVGIDDIHW